MVIKLMNIVVKPLIIPFSESFFSKNGIFAQENERSKLNFKYKWVAIKDRLKNWEFEISDVTLE